MKHNLKDFPELFKPQGKVAVPTIDLKDSLEVFNLIRQVDEWKTCFEKELRERFEKIKSEEMRAFECFFIKELLGEDKP